jgi:hypothetical protein
MRWIGGLAFRRLRHAAMSWAPAFAGATGRGALITAVVPAQVGFHLLSVCAVGRAMGWKGGLVVPRFTML